MIWLKVLGFFVWYPLHFLLAGFTYMKGWEWFIAPLGMPVIGLLHAVGLAVVLKMFASGFPNADASSNKLSVERAATQSLTFALVLLIIWIIQFFM